MFCAFPLKKLLVSETKQDERAFDISETWTRGFGNTSLTL